MKGVIDIVGLVLFAKHGVGEEEARLGQKFVLDIQLEADLTEAVKHDRLVDTVDYGEVVAVTEVDLSAANAFISSKQRRRMSRPAFLRTSLTVKYVRVTVKKPSAPISAVFDYVATTVERKRDG